MTDELRDRRERLDDMLKPAHGPRCFNGERDQADEFIHRRSNAAGPNDRPVRSIGEAFQHISSEYYVFAPMAYGATPSPIVGRGRENFAKFETTPVVQPVA